MNSVFKQLLLGGSACALIAGATIGAAFAQTPAGASDNSVESVEVSASRINLAGFQSPTPVTVIGTEQIEKNARLDVADEIRDLPEVQGSSASRGAASNNAAQGNAGINSLSLRGLGSQRNLVLIDGQRVVSAAIQDGTVDLATVPTSMVQRIDVVTGGASAAWGSDAVTGVVNLVINKNFTGIKGNAEFSNNALISRPQYKAEVAFGTDFDGDKGHTEFAVNTLISNTPTFNGQNRKNYGRAVVYNPAYCNQVTYPVVNGVTQTSGGTCSSLSGQPVYTYAYATGNDTTTQGGLINANTAGTAGSGLVASTASSAAYTGLRGIDFVGPDGTPTPFNYGTVSQTTCYNGCTNDQNSGTGPWGISSAAFHQWTFFNYSSYQVTPDIKASVQVNYGHFIERNTASIKTSASNTIYADNAYLDPSIAQRFVCSGTTCAANTTTLSNGYNPFTGQGSNGQKPGQTLTVGWDFMNNRITPSQAVNQGANIPWTMDNLCSAIGQPCNNMARTVARAVFKLEGPLFSNDWNWDASVEASQARIHQTLANDPITARLNNALDAVRVTASNVGTSGLPIGSIQCRGLLIGSTRVVNGFDDLTGCQPINMFGFGNVSNQARAWINPGLNQSSTGILDQETIHTNQVSAAFNVNGVLPWKLPAGDVGVALGAEYRLEQAGQFDVDPHSAAAAYQAGNFAPWEGHLHVEEGFLEVNAPVLKNQLVQTLDLDLAGRITQYSSAGDTSTINGTQPPFNFLVETWKMGFNSQLTDEFRLRGFYSYDIRAPIVYDLYNPGNFNSQTCASWVNGGSGNPCFAKQGGNSKLQPEKANTVAISVVYTPTWLDGFTTSVDWYDLRLHGGLVTTNFATVISRAKAGEAAYCAQIIDTAGDNICTYSQTSGTAPQITQVNVGSVNAAELTTAGFDVKAQYNFPLFSGTATLSAAANYVYDWSQTLNGIYFQGAGCATAPNQVGQSCYYGQGQPKLTGNIQGTYRTGAWTFGVEAHFAGASVKDRGTEGQAGLVNQSVTYSKVAGQDIAAISSGQRGLGVYSPEMN